MSQQVRFEVCDVDDDDNEDDDDDIKVKSEYLS